MDLTTLTDDELAQLQRDVSDEQRTRATLSAIPLQITELAAQYRDGGGDPDALLDAITTTETEEPAP